MSALAVYKPNEQAPSAKKPSAADLLAGATKKGKSSNHLVYVGEVGCEAAARRLDVVSQPGTKVNKERAIGGAELQFHGARPFRSDPPCRAEPACVLPPASGKTATPCRRG
jgi:hypothetical protein